MLHNDWPTGARREIDRDREKERERDVVCLTRSGIEPPTHRMPGQRQATTLLGTGAVATSAKTAAVLAVQILDVEY